LVWRGLVVELLGLLKPAMKKEVKLQLERERRGLTTVQRGPASAGLLVENLVALVDMR